MISWGTEPKNTPGWGAAAVCCAQCSDLHSLPACVASWSLSMANSRFQYVKKFELPDTLLPDTYLVARLDGHRFTNFTAQHGFTKPNDERGLLLMTEVSIARYLCLPVYPFLCISVCLSNCLAVWLSACLSGCLSVHLGCLDGVRVHANSSYL